MIVLALCIVIVNILDDVLLHIFQTENIRPKKNHPSSCGFTEESVK